MFCDFRTDFAESDDADGGLEEVADILAAGPVGGKVVFVTFFWREAPIGGFVGDADHFSDATGEGEHLEDAVLGDPDAGTDGHVADGDVRFLGGLEVYIVGAGTEALDEAEVFAGGDDVGIYFAGAFGDEEFFAWEQADDFFFGGSAAHGDFKFGWGGLESGLLVAFSSLGDEKDGMFRHAGLRFGVGVRRLYHQKGGGERGRWGGGGIIGAGLFVRRKTVIESNL